MNVPTTMVVVLKNVQTQKVATTAHAEMDTSLSLEMIVTPLTVEDYAKVKSLFKRCLPFQKLLDLKPSLYYKPEKVDKYYSNCSLAMCYI